MTLDDAVSPASESAVEVPGAEADAPRQFLSFTVADRDYCVGIGDVREIRQWMRTTPLPNQPAHMLGVLNLRGAIVPVQDLRVRFGADAAPPVETNVIVIVQQAERRLGLLVDSVSDILSLTADAIRPVPGQRGPVATAPLLGGLAVTEGGMVGIVDLAQIMQDGGADVGDA